MILSGWVVGALSRPPAIFHGKPRAPKDRLQATVQAMDLLHDHVGTAAKCAYRRPWCLLFKSERLPGVYSDQKIIMHQMSTRKCEKHWRDCGAFKSA